MEVLSVEIGPGSHEFLLSNVAEPTLAPFGREAQTPTSDCLAQPHTGMYHIGLMRELSEI